MSRKKQPTLVIVLVMAVAVLGTSTAAFSSGTSSPTDISGHWAEPQIRQLIDLGVVNGYPDGTFRPEASVTRAQFLKMLVLAVGAEPVRTLDSPYQDTEQHWFYTMGYQEAAMRLGISPYLDFIGGVEAIYPQEPSLPSSPDAPPPPPPAPPVYLFKPDQEITRGQIAIFIVRAMGGGAQAEIMNEGFGFGSLALAAKVLEGYPDGSFGYERGATRAEACVMISRVLAVPDTFWDPVNGTFIRCYGTGQSGFRCLRELAGGGFILAGHKQDWPSITSDAWLIRVDADGRKLWEKTFGSPTVSDAAYSVAPASDGGYWVAGVDGAGNLGSQDGWVIKTDGQGKQTGGNIHVFNSATADQARVVIAAPDGGCVVAGTQDMGYASVFDYMFGDVVAVRLDAQGAEKWRTRISAGARLYDMAQSADGKAVLLSGVFREPSSGHDRPFLAKVNLDTGALAWLKGYPGPRDYGDRLTGIAATPDGGWVITGTAGSKVRLLKVNADGTSPWETTVGEDYCDGIDVIVRPDGGYAVIGYRNGSDTWLAGIAADRTVEWSHYLKRRDHEDAGTDLILAEAGGYAIVTKLGWTDRAAGGLLIVTDPEGALYPYPES